jgi:alkaline phosphatase D
MRLHSFTDLPCPSPFAAARSCRREGGAGCLIPKQKVPLPWGGSSLWPVGMTVSRIAFGSCAAYDARAQPIWEEGVIPSQPDAFVWLGDFYYADEALFECSPQNLNASQCQCTADWLKQPPFMCQAGELDNARDKMVAQVGGARVQLQP